MATAKPKSTKADSEHLRGLYRPGVRELGLKIIAQAQDEAAAKKDAPAPESAADEYLRLQAGKIVADALLEVATEKRKAEKDKAATDAERAEEDKEWQASQAFSSAHHAWLIAKTALEEPSVAEDDQPRRFKAESDAERRLFTTPAAYGDQFWDKLTAFERILGDEIMSGPRKDSIILLALASVKQDIVNLDLCCK
jgi:hypothetical protein